MSPSILYDPQNLFDSWMLTEAVATFPPEICRLTESCDIAQCDVNDERFTEKYGIAMKTNISSKYLPRTSVSFMTLPTPSPPPPPLYMSTEITHSNQQASLAVHTNANM